MNSLKAIPVVFAFAIVALQSAYADEGDSKLIGPMFTPIRIENPSALEHVKGRTLQDRGLIDGIVGPAMKPPVTKKHESGSSKSKGTKDSR
jgi:hypothetical protein